MSKLNRRVWQNNNMTQMKNLHVYQACVFSTLLYSSVSWTTYTRQDMKLNSFLLRWLRHIIYISWQDKVTIQRYWSGLTASAYTHCYANGVCDGLAMSIECLTVASRESCCMASSSLERTQQTVRISAANVKGKTKTLFFLFLFIFKHLFIFM